MQGDFLHFLYLEAAFKQMRGGGVTQVVEMQVFDAQGFAAVGKVFADGLGLVREYPGRFFGLAQQDFIGAGRNFSHFNHVPAPGVFQVADRHGFPLVVDVVPLDARGFADPPGAV